MKITLSSLLLSCLAIYNTHADLVAHWPLDSDALDATGNGFDGTVVDGTVNFGQTGANANTGSSASFPDNGRIDVPFDAALNPESFTITLWANTLSTVGFASPITSRDDVLGTGTHGYILYKNSGGSWDFWTGDGDVGWDSLVGDPVIANTWTHLAITYDATTDTKTLYIDGVVSATDNVPQSGPTQYAPNGTVEMENLHIGAGQDDGLNFFFDGLLDDVAIWDEVLTPTVIQSVMNNGVSSGLPDPSLSTNSPIEFTADGTIQQFEIPITNAGQTENLVISEATFDGDPNFSVVSFPATISPDSTENLILSFDPSGGNGLFEAILEVTSNDELTVVESITVQAIIADPLLVSESVVDLGTETTGSLTITNNGETRALNISQLNITGTDADKFSADGPDTLLANGGTGTIDIQFNAQGEEGNFTAVLEILSDDPLAPTTMIDLTASVPFGDTLVAWWPLDVDGTDASGNGFDGEIIGNNPVAMEGANAATGMSLAFDGASRIDVPFDENLNPESFTLTLWANATDTAGFASPITSRDDVNAGVSTHGYIIYNDNNGIWNFWTGDGNPGWDTLGANSVLTETWSHLAVSYDSVTETKNFWIDGVLIATDTAPNQYSQNGTVEMENLHIGAGADDGNSFYFNGKIDDVAIFRTALTGEEINTIITGGVAGFTGLTRALEIVDLAFGPEANQITISFTSVTGGVYVVERSESLLSDSWLELTDNVASEGDITTFTDSSVPADSKKLFYRVRRP